ncbi:hypothetical protein RUM43_010511 [Polyplax serrata]|uniref:SHSP domain-containing protein n=1 Tax=Polyplax serrata TaxID=468196 RepID=A0AAN8Q501_POLSC
MSVIPLILNDAFDGFLRPGCSFNPDFHFGIFSNDFDFPRAVVRVPRSRACCRPCPTSHERKAKKSSEVAVPTSDNEFKVNIDVQDYKPENLSVKIVDNTITIEGKHEEKQDEHGYISRQFSRRYVLPEGVDTNNVVSRLSTEGVLSISAPKKVSRQFQSIRRLNSSPEGNTPQKLIHLLLSQVQLPPSSRVIPIQHGQESGAVENSQPPVTNGEQEKMEQ